MLRIIPCLQLINERLVKTTRFRNPEYIGDPVNTVRIFNELEVDELCFIDIRASEEKRPPSFGLLTKIAEECFMPLSYGGGICDMETAGKVFSCGYEKLIIGTAATERPELIEKLAGHFGTQAIIAAIDVKKTWSGNYRVYTHSATRQTNLEPVAWAQRLEKLGAGEILLTSIDREGTWMGLDIALIKKLTESVSIPVIALGGAANPGDIAETLYKTGVSAIGLGNLVVYQKKGMGVLIQYPKQEIGALYGEQEENIS